MNWQMETGTFMSRDPLAAGPGWLGSGFGYAGGNPVNGGDPTGLIIETRYDDFGSYLYDTDTLSRWDDGVEGWVDPNGWVYKNGQWNAPALVALPPASAPPQQTQGASSSRPTPLGNQDPSQGGIQGLANDLATGSDLMLYGSAATTDFMAGMGCFAGPHGCVVGYGAGRAITQPFMVEGAYMGGTSTALTCFFGGDSDACAKSLFTRALPPLLGIEDPNLGVLVDLGFRAIGW